jgi:hypothetical protein
MNPTLGGIYNPQEMPEAEFLARYSVRLELTQNLLQSILANGPDDEPKHFIIQGQRGQGKTSLLRKLFLALRENTGTRDWLVPLLFKEELYGVTNLCRLWEEAASLLEGQPAFAGLADEFEAAWGSPHYDKDCHLILDRALQDTNIRLVLLIDSLNAENIGQLYEATKDYLPAPLQSELNQLMAEKTTKHNREKLKKKKEQLKKINEKIRNNKNKITRVEQLIDRLAQIQNLVLAKDYEQAKSLLERETYIRDTSYPAYMLIISELFLFLQMFTKAFTLLKQSLPDLDLVQHNQIISTILTILIASGQTAYMLRLFESEEFATYRFRDHFKPFYYALLAELGESRADDFRRMGPELAETVQEIRENTIVWRVKYFGKD